MYLSLAAIVLLAVLAGDYLLARGPWSRRGATAATMVVAVIAGLFALLTHTRNTEYYSEHALWSANVEDRPESYVAQDSLGSELAEMNEPVEAMI